MFWNKSKREQDLVEREMKQYKKELQSDANIQFREAIIGMREERFSRQQEMFTQLQVKQLELVKLEALIEAKKSILTQDQTICEFLKKIIELLAKNNA